MVVQISPNLTPEPTITVPQYPSDLSSTTSSSTLAPATAANTWTELQPDIFPAPSVPPGFPWTSYPKSWYPDVPTTTTVNTSMATFEPPATSTTHLADPSLQPLSPTSSCSTTDTIASTSVQSSPTYANSSAAASSTTAAPASSCEDGSAIFTVDFDELPSFSAGPSDVDIPPIFNPYRKLYWEGHFGYVPPPTDPFPPHSPPQLAVYRASGYDVNASRDAGLELKGEIGAGPRADTNAYWIDVYSAWLGCADGGPDECTITLNGYIDGESNANISQNVTQPPCPGLKNCLLTQVLFNGGFRGLTGLQIIATVGGDDVDYYLDDLQLGWSNNSCAAQLLRSSSE